MTRRIPRLAAEPREDDAGIPAGPGWWFWVPEAEGADAMNPRRWWVLFRCPWGHDARIGDHHSIERTGEVQPSLVCTCGRFHEFVVLDDWPPHAYKHAGPGQWLRGLPAAGELA